MVGHLNSRCSTKRVQIVGELLEFHCTLCLDEAKVGSFGKDNELVCGLHTSYKEAEDWHRIDTTTNSPVLAPRGTSVTSKHTRSQILAITTSPKFNAVALASPSYTAPREFLLEFKQQCYYPLNLVLNSAMVTFGCKLVEPISFSFSKCGTQLILLTAEVHISSSESLLTFPRALWTCTSWRSRIKSFALGIDNRDWYIIYIL